MTARQMPNKLGRFSLLRKIGEGGFGVVFEAEDTRYQCRVALKVLRQARVSDVYRFKQEFRSLADLMHRNLVRLYELGADADVWYFTMELVSGGSFLSYVWGQEHDRTLEPVTQDAAPRPVSGVRRVHPQVSPSRLRTALLELAEGVQALHAERKLHCDIKPSNVLISEHGRVVLLDFGLVTDLDANELDLRGLIGTPGYIAPELVERREATRASDWFGVGALLHEALTGTTPSAAGPRFDFEDPANEELRRLCTDLLASRPELRPTGDEVLRRLRDPQRASRAQPSVLPGGRAFVGRKAQLAELETHWRTSALGQPVMVRIVGPSGVGKSALARHFLDQLRQREPQALVVNGRCYEHEFVPYKALDGLMDALGRQLATLPQAELNGLLPANAPLLTRLFRAFEPLTPAADTTDAILAMQSQAQRRLAFSALRELLQRVAERRRVVLCLDDLHWGDVDSARLLLELLRPPQTLPLLVLTSYRPTESDSFWRVFDEAKLGITEHRISLGDLTAEESQLLAGQLLGMEDEGLVSAIADEGAGSPIFIQQLAQRATFMPFHESGEGVSLNGVISDQLQHLDADARRLVEAVAMAGQPVPEEVAVEAAALSGAAARDATQTVRKARIVIARSANYTSLLEAVHDRIGTAVRAALPADEQRGYHTRLAAALLNHGQPEPETLLRHYAGAGDDDKTREYALLAADRAERAFAFDRSAEHYATALRLTPSSAPDRWLVIKRWADALDGAGRAGEAAEAFQAAADSYGSTPNSNRVQTLALNRRSGELALRSGRLELGSRRLDAVLKSLGVRPPRTRLSAMLSAIVKRLRLFVRGFGFKPRPASEIEPEALERLDALWGASTGIAMSNHVVADALGLEHLHLALALGERSHVVRGLGYEAAFEAVLGGAFMRRRCKKILQLMEDLARESDVPYDHAWARMSKGVTSWFLGDWSASWENCDAAARLYRERCQGVAWELAICDAYRLPALTYLGDLAKLSEVVPQALEGARERGDLFASSMLRLGQQSMQLLADDRPEAVIETAHEAVAPFPEKPYLLPHYHHLFAVTQAELYLKRPANAWHRMEEAQRGLKQSQLLMVQCLRVEIRHLRARTAIALAADLSINHRPELSRSSLLRIARAEAKVIERDDVAPAQPFAATIYAAVANAEGRPDEAQRQLQQALSGFEAAQMTLYAEATRDRLSAMIGGTDGAELQGRAAGWLASQGVRNQSALVAMLLPGV